MADKVKVEIIPFIKDEDAKSVAKAFALPFSVELSKQLTTELTKSLGLVVAKTAKDFYDQLQLNAPKPGKGLGGLAKSFSAPKDFFKDAWDSLKVDFDILTKGAAGLPGAGGVAAGAGAIAGVAGLALGGITGTIGTVSGILDKIVGFVEKANPAVVEVLSQVLDDVSGVIGQTLVPVLEAAIPLVRAFGDFLATILPSQQEMRQIMEALQPAIDGVVAAMKDLQEPIQALVKSLVELLVPALRAVAEFVGWLYRNTYGLLGRSLKGAGLEGTSRSSVGAAARGASAIGLEELGTKLVTGAFGGSPIQRTAEAAEAIRQILERGLPSSSPAPAFLPR